MQHNDPVISIVIPVWNGERRIVNTLKAIARQTAPRSRFEVIVVDNGSTDGTTDAVRKFDFVTLLAEQIPGSYRARNLGLRVARGEYTLFTDGDCVPAPDWVEQAPAATEREPDAGLYAGDIALFREEGAHPIAACYEELTAFNQRYNVEHGYCVTANWLCRRDDLRAIGGFNPGLLSGGDAECSRRTVASGHKIVHVPEMIVGHPTHATLGELISKRRRVIGGRRRIGGMYKAGVSKSLWQMIREAAGQARWMIRTNIGVGTQSGPRHHRCSHDCVAGRGVAAVRRSPALSVLRYTVALSPPFSKGQRRRQSQILISKRLFEPENGQHNRRPCLGAP